MGTKLARALGLGLNGVSLWLIGFSAPEAAGDPGMGWGLAVLFGPVVGILFLGAGLVLWFMPLTEEQAPAHPAPAAAPPGLIPEPAIPHAGRVPGREQVAPPEPPAFQDPPGAPPRGLKR